MARTDPELHGAQWAALAPAAATPAAGDRPAQQRPPPGRGGDGVAGPHWRPGATCRPSTAPRRAWSAASTAGAAMDLRAVVRRGASPRRCPRELDCWCITSTAASSGPQHAAGARHRPSVEDHKRGSRTPPDEALGRGRGGVSTKLHHAGRGHRAAAGHPGYPGQRHDVTRLQVLLDAGAVTRSGPDGRAGRGQPRKLPIRLVGDKGCAFPSARRLLRRRGNRSVIRTKSDQRACPASTGVTSRGVV